MIEWCLVFNATFSNFSAKSWRPVLVVKEAGVPGENRRPWASNWYTLSLAVASRLHPFCNIGDKIDDRLVSVVRKSNFPTLWDTRDLYIILNGSPSLYFLDLISSNNLKFDRVYLTSLATILLWNFVDLLTSVSHGHLILV